MEVKIYSKEMCLKIAKTVRADKDLTDDELVQYLPDWIFGKTLRVSSFRGFCEVYGKPGIDGLCDRWEIPTYFIEEIWKYGGGKLDFERK